MKSHRGKPESRLCTFRGDNVFVESVNWNWPGNWKINGCIWYVLSLSCIFILPTPGLLYALHSVFSGDHWNGPKRAWRHAIFLKKSIISCNSDFWTKSEPSRRRGRRWYLVLAYSESWRSVRHTGELSSGYQEMLKVWIPHYPSGRWRHGLWRNCHLA